MLTEAFDALQNLLTMVLTPRKTDELDWNRDIPDVKNCEKFSIDSDDKHDRNRLLRFGPVIYLATLSVITARECT